MSQQWKLEWLPPMPDIFHALSAQAHPFWAIVVATYVLEDAALLASIGLMATGHLSLLSAAVANFVGISSGDLLLYAAGHFSRKLRPHRVQPRLPTAGISTSAIALARFMPGARLPLYFAAGWTGFGATRFIQVVLVTVAGWVGLALCTGEAVITPLRQHPLLAVACCSALFLLSRTLQPSLFDPWRRRALRHRWRRWLSFEFWPAWLFYPPVVAYYAWLTLRYRDIRLPLYANPTVRHGGLIGESKWDYLRFAGSAPQYALKSFYLPQPIDAEALLVGGQLKIPFIMKPDLGQRGYGVRLIRSTSELSDYIRQADFAAIAQEFCDWPHEAGIFYSRRPGTARGTIFSLTDKRFPAVIGDGYSQLGKLILRDRRAKIIAATYFERLFTRLDWIPAPGERVPLGACGNHCQGAIFLNGKNLITEALVDAIDTVAKSVPHFYIGRIDLRYQSVEQLRLGQGIKVIEINGAGAEATHIWDPQTTLVEAYQTLFAQWRLLFEIGYEVNRLGLRQQPVTWAGFAKDLWALSRRDQGLATSS